MNSQSDNPNLKLISTAIVKLAPLLDRIVFVGGCATGLLITDPGAAPVRVTYDVDVIVELTSSVGFVIEDELLQSANNPKAALGAPVRPTGDVDAIVSASYAALVKLETRLRQLGFRESQEEGAPRCRWVSGDLILDFMPTDPSVLGFSNRWYRPALESSQKVRVGDHEIRLVTAPYFLATKLEAFHGRGKDDYQMSHDLEDILTVIDGRPELATEVSLAPSELRRYLREEFRTLLARPDFHEALPGHLLPDQASQQRAAVILSRIQSMIED